LPTFTRLKYTVAMIAVMSKEKKGEILEYSFWIKTLATLNARTYRKLNIKAKPLKYTSSFKDYCTSFV